MMFELMLTATDEIEADLLVQESEADGLREMAGECEGLAGGRGIGVALRGIAREVGMHAEAMRDQLRALRAACEQHLSNHQHQDDPAVMH